MSLDVADARARKIAETPAEEAALAREATILRMAAHPGVVAFAGPSDGAEAGSLETSYVAGPPLRDLPGTGVEVAAGIGAALATTVADLHHLGIAHQAIAEDHVLLDESGRPVLCGFGHAVTAAEVTDFEAFADQDVLDVARLIAILLDDTEAPRIRSVLDRATRTRLLRRRVDARSLARLLIEAEPQARLPGGQAPTYGSVRPADCSGRSRSRRPAGRRSLRPARPKLAVGAAVAAVAAAVVAAAAAPGLMETRPSGRAGDGGRPPATLPCPPVDMGCRAVVLPANDPLVVGGTRFGLSQTRGTTLTIIGRWTCDGAGLPAVIVAGSGQVWLFLSWPGPGTKVAAHLVATVGGASGAVVIPTTTGCDALAVDRVGGPVVRVRMGER
jgi:hypothetical protein